MKKNHVSNIYKFPLTLCLGIILLFSCKRDDTEVIGPDLAIASSNFQVLSPFEFNYVNSNFSTVDGNWFNATFNERVSWEITIKGTQSKAYRTIKGVSTEINQSNSTWKGSHSGLYFFKEGEQVIAELMVFGYETTFLDTSTIVADKINYGSDVLIWWDMVDSPSGGLGVAANGFPNNIYWYDFFDTNEKVEGFMDSARISNDPIQGYYRSIEGKDGLGPSAYFVGACSHTPHYNPQGFNAPLNEIYLNFYVRPRTATSGMSIQIISFTSGDTATLNFDAGALTGDGWRLVSSKLSDMQLDTSSYAAFNPATIRQIRANMQITTTVNQDQTGFDIDFITITKGGPFDPSKYP